VSGHRSPCGAEAPSACKCNYAHWNWSPWRASTTSRSVQRRTRDGGERTRISETRVSISRIRGDSWRDQGAGTIWMAEILPLLTLAHAVAGNGPALGAADVRHRVGRVRQDQVDVLEPERGQDVAGVAAVDCDVAAPVVGLRRRIQFCQGLYPVDCEKGAERRDGSFPRPSACTNGAGQGLFGRGFRPEASAASAWTLVSMRVGCIGLPSSRQNFELRSLR
jgi:hypothetical protein